MKRGSRLPLKLSRRSIVSQGRDLETILPPSKFPLIFLVVSASATSACSVTCVWVLPASDILVRLKIKSLKDINSFTTAGTKKTTDVVIKETPQARSQVPGLHFVPEKIDQVKR